MRLPAFFLPRLRDYLVSTATARPPDFIIGREPDAYLRRWWIIRRNRWFNVYLHQFLRSDDDRALHDHPWFNFSVILMGTYTEHTISAGGVNIRKIYQAGDIKPRRSIAAHRVELHDGPCWSLFITGPVVREWGFHCPRGWRHWRDFVDDRDAGQIGKGCA